MSNIRNIGDTFDALIKDSAVKKYTYTLSESKKLELNLEDGDFKLMRTVFDNYGSIRVFENNRMGSVGGNDISEEGLKKLIEDSLSAARSADEDPCHDIAPGQGSDIFVQGLQEPDTDRFIERVQEFLKILTSPFFPKGACRAINKMSGWGLLSGCLCLSPSHLQVRPLYDFPICLSFQKGVFLDAFQPPSLSLPVKPCHSKIAGRPEPLQGGI
jgi:hypothetical protein